MPASPVALSAVVFDYWLNDSVLGGWQWLGAILLISAITMVTLGGRPAEAPEATEARGNG